MNRALLIDDNHVLLSKVGLDYAVFPSDFAQIRYFTLLLIKNSRPRSDERLLLEQQVSEIIKNAVKHGNGCDPSRKVEIWYRFSESEARLIVSDEGPGFADIEKWNAFNGKRQDYIDREDFVGLAHYVSWRTSRSDKFDGGNAMFAALEYWDMGVVYTGKRNTVAVGKHFTSEFMEMGGDE